MTFTLPNSGAAKGEFGYDLPQDMNGLHHAIKEALDLIVKMQAEIEALRVKSNRSSSLLINSLAFTVKLAFTLDEYDDLAAEETRLHVHTIRERMKAPISTEGSSNG